MVDGIYAILRMEILHLTFRALSTSLAVQLRVQSCLVNLLWTSGVCQFDVKYNSGIIRNVIDFHIYIINKVIFVRTQPKI